MAIEATPIVVKEIAESLYHSVIVNSSPDISHFNRLTMILRYIKFDALLVEKIFTFIPNSGHEGIKLAETDISTLVRTVIGIKFWRDRSYDNAANVSGKDSTISRRKRSVKIPPDTRWSARYGSVDVLTIFCLYTTLNAVEADEDNKPAIKCQAPRVRLRLGKLETAF
ncbi:hypothetical protein QAD02_006051 [Eretmocerus hayati]|uniref:Uncharacterized protein n=1 Tax=Eretmocerus hayati TaxID=131215 RepID=A0ACC2MZZ2_9HYME|nr:hypothetical protein QAD02_006051 [Eretmocerus hayati]